jgi:hypothetical protein
MLNRIHMLRVLPAVMCLFIVVGCSKDDDPIKVSDGTMLAMVEGKKVQSSTIEAEYMTDGKQLLVFATFMSSGQEYFVRLSLSSNNVNADVTTRTYTVLGNNAPVSEGDVAYGRSAAGIFYLSSSVTESQAGSIVITEFDVSTLLVSGTFESKVQMGSEVRIVSGEFRKVPFVLS